MLKYLSCTAIAALALVSWTTLASADGDPAAGEKVFRKCKACHAVGDGAKNKVGPHLNEVFGRAAGSIDGFKYSPAMIKAGSDGLVWDAGTMSEFLAKPKAYIAKTKMSFVGLKKEEDRNNVIAYLAKFSAEKSSAAIEEPETATVAAAEPAGETAATVSAVGTHGNYGLGRPALPEEIAAWDIDIRPDGTGLPEGKGTVSDGEAIYAENCAQCHGDFGEGVDRWPVLAGGFDSLTEERPVKTIGSYWPYLSTVYDYIQRAMPFGNARSLSNDDIYAITAYLLYLNDIVTDEDFELSRENFLEHRLPNEENFIPDGRAEEPQYASRAEPCMTNCKEGTVEITMRAAVLNVTPESEEEGGAGAIE